MLPPRQFLHSAELRGRCTIPIFLLADAVLVVLVLLVYFAGTLWFANRHPGGALLEGAELIQWRQMDMAAKSSAQIDSIPVLPEPESRDPETR